MEQSGKKYFLFPNFLCEKSIYLLYLFIYL